MSTFYKLFMVLSIITLSSCASILQGSTKRVSIYTPQKGTKIYVDGNYLGKNRIITNLTRKDNHIIDFKKDGYETISRTLTPSFQGGWVFLDIITLTGLVGILIDTLTGSWYTFDEGSKITIPVLEPLKIEDKEKK